MAITKTGPVANLPATARRLGRGGHTFDAAGNFLGNVTACTWDVEAERIDVLIPGGWRNSQVAGNETRTFTLNYQDVDDRYRLMMWDFFEARRTGDFSAQTPLFNLVTVLVGGPVDSRWQLTNCQVFTYSGGYSNEDDVMNRELQGNFDSDRPLNAFVYGAGGIVQRTG